MRNALTAKKYLCYHFYVPFPEYRETEVFDMQEQKNEAFLPACPVETTLMLIAINGRY